MAGRLRGEASAYLRQHAGNPVDWWPFGDAAFDEARRRNVPVFISVGYAACHWCHVMAHESFEDQATAEYLNGNFVSIKVDREERPDVDAVYMAATQAMTGQGGWPMSVFTLPDGRTFYAGTYFPPRPVQGMPSFRDVLEAVSAAWRDRPEEVEQSAAQLAAHLASGQQGNRRLLGPVRALGVGIPADPAADGAEAADGHARTLSSAVEALGGLEDQQFGGFGGAPKFPPSTVLRFLLAHAAGGASTADDAASLADRTLGAMARSALYDQLEGGFARYTVDRRWAVPHFEKMLYDNVQLLALYAQWARSARDPEDRRLALRVTLETADWMINRLQVDGGGFASSLDADTVMDGHRVEGGTYVWTEGELAEVLGSETADAVAGLLDLDAGNMAAHGGKPGPDGNIGSTLHFGRRLSPDEEELWLRSRPALLAARNRRPQPERDDKVVAGWNGLAVAALARAAVVLADAGETTAAERVRRAAVDAAAYLLRVHRAGPTLLRVSHGGRGQGIEGLLEDYAAAAEGLFALYAATGDEQWYAAAESLVLQAGDRFLTGDVLLDTAIRPNQLANAQGAQAAADPLDGPTPSGAALFAGVLLTYAAYSGSLRHRALAESLLAHVAVVAPRAPQAAGWSMSVLQFMLDGPRELAVTGTDAAAVEELLRAARDAGGPGLVVASQVAANGTGDPQSGAPGRTRVPLLEGRGPGTEPAVAYLCRGMVCRRPVSTPAELTELLREG
jgi:uncharacterized protein YyaL (SSP411 family)